MFTDDQLHELERLLEQRASAHDDDLMVKLNDIAQKAANQNMYGQGPHIGQEHRGYREHLIMLSKVLEHAVEEFLNSRGITLSNEMIDNQIAVVIERVLDRKFADYSGRLHRQKLVPARSLPLRDVVEMEVARIKTDFRLKMGRDAQAAATSTVHSVMNIYGDGNQARINNNAVDNSTNSTATLDIVAELKAKLQQSDLDAAHQQALLEALDELRAAQHTPEFQDSFAKVMGLAANAMTIIQPFIPALMKLGG